MFSPALSNQSDGSPPPSHIGQGNRLTKTVNGTTETYAYDDGDKLIDIKVSGVAVKTFQYDGAGRTTQIATSGYTRNFSYDYESRITQIPGLATTNTFSYNGLDTRTKKVDSAGTSNFQRVGAYVTDAVVADGAATYTPGLSERRSGVTEYLHAGLKNADLQTNSSQANAGTKRFDAFGLQVGGVGTFQGPSGYGGKFGYQSSEDSELMLLGHRYYDPNTGRFLTRDPGKDGRNWYSYCDGSPAGRVDPNGRSWEAVKRFGRNALSYLDDVMDGAHDWWNGVDVIGPGGEPVRVGGWPGMFNYATNAMTVNETVHLNDHDDFANYVNNLEWSRHERHHIYQEEEYHSGNAIGFVITIGVQYLYAGGHDWAPYEVEADAATQRRQPPHPTGLYKWFL
ncbi:MAG TPA: RHS repeat-associated core domain-containing protein [Fimbriimonadaceae bacterium]|nr:RHS repeat-associated core domain-containing protein [Fimbriimonadaceae bacterium]